MEHFKGFSLRIQSITTEITNNIFHYIDDHALDGIIPPLISPNLNSKPPARTLNISNNTIHVLAPKSLELDSSKTDEKTYFDNIIIMNNSITCSCQNVFWFDSISFDSFPFTKRLFNHLWFDKDNSNKCLNIRNCYLYQISHNFHELCFENYKCPNVSGKRFFYNSKMNSEEDKKEGDLVMVQNIKDVLGDLKNFLKEDKSERFENFDSEFGTYLKPVFFCLLITTILFGLTLCYVLIAKFYKLQIFQISVRQRSKNLNSGHTELSSSLVSLT